MPRLVGQFYSPIRSSGATLNATNFLASTKPLHMSDAVAAFLMLQDGRYLMQLRDDDPHIWYPGVWGLYVGGLEDGEDIFAASRRELREERELEMGEARLFPTVDFDWQPTALTIQLRPVCKV